MWQEAGARASLFLPPMRGVRGFDSAELRLADKAAELSPPPALRRERGSRSTRSRRRAVKHGAVGGRMTARRSGAVQRTTAATLRPEGVPRSRATAGFPTPPGAESPKVVFSSRVLVTRNIGCRSGSRHLDASSKERRKASRGRDVERRRRSKVRTGPMIVVLAERVLGRAKVERPAQAPSIMVPSKSVGPRSRPHRNRGRRVGA